MTDALDDLVRALARESLGIGCSVRGRRDAIGITIKGDRGHSDDRTFRKSFFQIVVLWFAGSQAEPPAVIMDHDADVLRVVEGRCAAIERGINEVPFRRIDLPDEIREFASVFLVARPQPAFCGKNNTGTTIRAQLLAATAACCVQGC